MTFASRRAHPVFCAALVAALLTGCAADSHDESEHKKHPHESATEACSAAPVDEAVRGALETLPPFMDQVPWDANSTRTVVNIDELYQPCAELSAVPVTVENASGSSPVHILLFHRGEFLGTATKEPRAFMPEMGRVDDATIRVFYRYLQEGDSNAMPSGLTEVTFKWDDQLGEMTHAGEFPPAS